MHVFWAWSRDCAKACMCICEYRDVYVYFIGDCNSVYTLVDCQLVNMGIVYFGESIKEERLGLISW